MGYTIITHSTLLEKALRRFPEISEIATIPHLITDVSNIRTMASNPYVKPAFENCRNISKLRKKLGGLSENPRALIAYEPRHDAASWAQQIGGIMRLHPKAKRYMPLRVLTRQGVSALLYSPESIPAFYPAEWIYLRMTESAAGANINAVCSASPMLNPLGKQNLYSIYLLYRCAKLSLQAQKEEYVLVLMDSYTGTTLGREMPAHGNAASYSDQTLAEKSAAECNRAKFTQCGTNTYESTMHPGAYPLTSVCMGSALRRAFMYYGDLINTLYGLYLEGAIEYPFSAAEGSPAGKAAFLFDRLKLCISEAECGKALKMHSKGAAVFPTEEIDEAGGVFPRYINFLVVNALRRGLKCTRKDTLYNSGKRLFVASEYCFHNLSPDAADTLSIHYPREVNPRHMCAYPVCLSSHKRIQFGRLMAFAANSPNLLKWLSALKHLVDTKLLHMEGEDLILSDIAIEVAAKIEEIYGPMFEDGKFLLFDEIHNNVGRQKALFFHITSKLPMPKSADRHSMER